MERNRGKMGKSALETDQAFSETYKPLQSPIIHIAEQYGFSAVLLLWK